MAEKQKKQPDLDLEVNRHEPVKVDDKGRIVLHKQFHDALGSDVVLVCDVAQNMWIYPAEVFNKTRQATKRRFSDDNGAAKMFMIAKFSNAREAEIDGSNRLPIPADLREASGVEKNTECVVIGSGRDFMILQKASYDRFLKNSAAFLEESQSNLDALRKRAFEEEEELRRLERMLSE